MQQASSEQFSLASHGGPSDQSSPAPPGGPVIINQQTSWRKQLHKHAENPIAHLTFSVDDERKEKKILRRCLEEGGAVSVSSETEPQKKYTIIFMDEAPSEESPNLPICSCPAYRYMSYDIDNMMGRKGACKHIALALELAGQMAIHECDWNYRQENDLYLLDLPATKRRQRSRMADI